jgi:hypothetical protein
VADKVGAFNRLGYSSTGNGTATVEYEFAEGSTLGLTEQFIDTSQIRGTLSHGSERVRRGVRRVDGSIIMAPTAVELVTLLPMIMGAAPSGTTYALSDTYTAVDFYGVRDGTVYTYDEIAVETATFYATEGGPMQVTMNVVAKEETQAGSMGAVTVDVTTQPFVLTDAVVTVAGSAREVSSFELTVQNVLEVKYRNSLTPTQIKKIDRIVTLSLPISEGDGIALYGSAVAGVAATVVLTNGAVSLSFSMAAVQAPKNPLPLGQRGILDFPWRGVARKTGSTLELVTVLDSTP